MNPPVIIKKEPGQEPRPDGPRNAPLTYVGVVNHEGVKRDVKKELSEQVATADNNTPLPPSTAKGTAHSTVNSSRKRVASSPNVANVVFNCGTCRCRLSSKQTLLWHMNVHDGIKPFECDICHNSFPTPNLLQNHRDASHDSSVVYSTASFMCETCGCRVRHAQELVWHMNIHNGIKPFECDICHLSFAIPFMVRNHCRSAHPQEKVET